MNVPTDDKDLDEQYEAELKVLAEKAVIEEEKPSETQVQKDYYAGVRSCVVLVWMFSNFALAATILNSAGLERASSNDQESEAKRSRIYLAVVLWSVAGLSAFRFIGASWFLILRMVSASPISFFGNPAFRFFQLLANFFVPLFTSSVAYDLGKYFYINNLKWESGATITVICFYGFALSCTSKLRAASSAQGIPNCRYPDSCIFCLVSDPFFFFTCKQSIMT